MSPSGPAEDELLQSLLAATHAAIYGYGVLGARLDEATEPLAQAADDAHRATRDALAGVLRDRGAEVPAPAASYDVAVPGGPEALALAVRLEEGLAVRWRDLVAGTDDPALRATGTTGLRDSAVRAVRWRAALGLRPPTVALPGVQTG